jgi:hypothetical protein
VTLLTKRPVMEDRLSVALVGQARRPLWDRPAVRLVTKQPATRANPALNPRPHLAQPSGCYPAASISTRVGFRPRLFHLCPELRRWLPAFSAARLGSAEVKYMTLV